MNPKLNMMLICSKKKKSKLNDEEFFFFTKKPCSIMNQQFTHSSYNKCSLVNKILLNIKQISAWKKLASFAIDSSKATIVSKALYNSEGSYGVIPEALNVPRFSTFSCAC